MIGRRPLSERCRSGGMELGWFLFVLGYVFYESCTADDICNYPGLLLSSTSNSIVMSS